MASKTDTQFSCNICGESFTHKFRLSRHKLQHTVEKSCDDCGKSFITLRSLNTHKKTMHPRTKHDRFFCSRCGFAKSSTPEDLTLKCNFCQKKFCTEECLKFHCKHTHSTKCADCPKVFETVADLEEHMDIHIGQQLKVSRYTDDVIYNCINCDFSTSSYTQLKLHEKIHITFRCPLCDQEFSSKDPLKTHVKKDHFVKCFYCKKTFTSKADLAVHQNIPSGTSTVTTEHQDKAPILQGIEYSCQKCNFSTQCSFHYADHQNSHHKFKCQICDQELNSRDELKEHKKAFHTVFKCQICDQELNSRDELKEHKKAFHTVDLKCDLCCMTFKNRRCLRSHYAKIHKRVLSTFQKYICSVCFVFGTNSLIKLREHELVHSTENAPFKCDLCDKGFSTIDTLNFHIKNHGSEKPMDENSQAQMDNDENLQIDVNDVDDLDIVKHEIEDCDSPTENLVDDPIEFMVDSSGDFTIKDEEIKEEPVETLCDDPLQTCP